MESNDDASIKKDVNWNSTFHERKMVFRIPVDNIPENEIEGYIREMVKKLKARREEIEELPFPVYDIYLPPHSATTGTHTANYISVEPNSHFWTDLNQLLTHLDNIGITGNQFYPNIFKEELKYIFIGLENTKKRGYKLKQCHEVNSDVYMPYSYFYDKIDALLDDVKFVNITEDYPGNAFLKDLITTINYTLAMGFNLTNGRKMERTDVYKRIDGERDYQDKTWGARRTADGTPDEEKSVAGWLIYIEEHLEMAKKRVYYLDTNEALAEIRKVAALAVRTMEIHGAPERVIVPEPKSCCDGGCACKKE